jgi:hypothetical protein
MFYVEISFHINLKTWNLFHEKYWLCLTIEKADTINSFSAVYNLAIKNMKNRYAPNTPAICSLSFEGNKPTSKVLVWSIIGN